MAVALSKLGIKPIEVGLMLEAVYQDGTIFTRDVLDVSEEKAIEQLRLAHTRAFNLCLEMKYFTKSTIVVFMQEAFRNAKALGIEAVLLERGIVEDVMARALAQAKSISGLIKEPPKEEKK